MATHRSQFVLLCLVAFLASLQVDSARIREAPQAEVPLRTMRNVPQAEKPLEDAKSSDDACYWRCKEHLDACQDRCAADDEECKSVCDIKFGGMRCKQRCWAGELDKLHKPQEVIEKEKKEQKWRKFH